MTSRTALAGVAVALGLALTGCPTDSGTPTNTDPAGGADATEAAPPAIDDQIQEAGIDVGAMETEAEQEAAAITPEEADTVLADLEAELAEDTEEE